MAVSLPTSKDVQKAREQAVKAAAERAETARTPLLAVLGAGDVAVATVARALEDVRVRAEKARARAAAQAEDVQHRAVELPQRLSTDELRRAVAELRVQLERSYEGFAARGQETWGRLRTQPQVEQALRTIEAYTEKLDARVDGFVDDAHDVAEKALATVTRRTRSVGEKAARRTEALADDAAQAVTTAAEKASEAVAETGAEVAQEITEAGDEAARETRSATRKAANRTAPTTTTTSKSAGRKPAARRAGGAKA
jgi:heparin binding hemagglutinin HbhA